MSEPLALVLGDADYAAMLPGIAYDANKYSRGTVAVIGGSTAYPGAPIMAARAAARAGAGYVRLVTTKSAASCAHAHLLSIPVTSCDDGIEGTLCETSAVQARADLPKSDVILIGPGMGCTADSKRFMAALEQDRPFVFDADALNLIAGDRSLLAGAAQHPRILTPHEGEAARLLGRKVANRKQDAIELATMYNATIVLKGPQTLVASPVGELREVSKGGPELSKAGTGDVLGGIIASFLAQGLSAFDAASLGVYVHGCAGKAAAREISAHAVMPEDIIDTIGAVLLNMEEKEIS